eukprot:jgi/Orpsp1_1/1182825/evm.model.c7180000082795.1
MNYLLFSGILLFTIIGNVYGRIVNFSIIAFANQVTVTFQERTLDMKRVDDYSSVFSASAICPDAEF